MEKAIYDKSIETRELQLVGFWAKLTHFGVIGYLLIMPLTLLIFHLIDFFQNSPIVFKEGELLLVFIPIVLAVVMFWIQKRRLRFQVVQTKLNHSQLKEIVVEVARQLQWEFPSSSENAYIAKTNPGFFSGSWGEQITILYYEDYVFVNSICDPEKRPSVISWGRNEENEETLIGKIDEANQLLTLNLHK